jgi:hypothetical protein
MSGSIPIFNGTNKRPFVAVGLPTFDDVKADFALSLAMMVAATRNVQFAFNHSKATWVAHARNLIVEGAIDMGAEWLLFLDSDMTFPRETLQRLMSWNKDIVCASYVKKKPPYATVGTLADRVGDGLAKTVEIEANGLYEMKEIGLGVCLVKMEVFKKLLEALVPLRIQARLQRHDRRGHPLVPRGSEAWIQNLDRRGPVHARRPHRQPRLPPRASLLHLRR